ALGRAAGGGHDEHVVVAVAVRREGDPLAVGGELGVGVAGGVDGEPAGVGAVVVDQPEVAEVAEDDLALVVVRVPGEPDFGGRQPGGRPTKRGYPGEEQGEREDASGVGREHGWPSGCGCAARRRLRAMVSAAGVSVKGLGTAA